MTEPDVGQIGQIGRFPRDTLARVEKFAQGVIGADLPLAQSLIAEGKTDEGLAIVRKVLDLQERRPDHPHRGNWPRFYGDTHIEDLNSGPFILKWLLPILFDHPDVVPPDARDVVGLALTEIDRLNVAPTYTNIALKSAFGLIVGGQWLDHAHFHGVGVDRWRAWYDLLVRNGAPREFNCSLYMGMNLTTLAKLERLADDERIKREARIVAERLWLHAATHYHRPTRQLAGPHARSYWASMLGGRDLFTEVLFRETGWEWVLEPGPYDPTPAAAMRPGPEIVQTHYQMPGFAKRWMDQPALPCETRETANRDEGYDLTTYQTPSYALGCASRSYSTGTDVLAIEQMANNLILHYVAPDGWRLMYSRFVVNDQHWGTLGSFPHRPNTNFFDQGLFAGVQSKGRAIALYMLRPIWDMYVTSLKTVVAFQSGDGLERVWQNDDWLVVVDGSVYVGIRPLTPTRLSVDAPIALERGPLGELWLAIYTFQGPSQRFWDYAALDGPFWRGNIRAGFIVEVAERSEHPSAEAFLDWLRGAPISDEMQGDIRTVSYRDIAIDVDLWESRLDARRIGGVTYEPPALQSPLGVQGDSGELKLGAARLVTNAQMMWLIADPDGSWIAVNPLETPTPVRLEAPLGVYEHPAFGQGRIEWRAGEDPRVR